MLINTDLNYVNYFYEKAFSQLLDRVLNTILVKKITTIFIVTSLYGR